MSFDSTTFVLEVLNFLVLVWLLQRFFYRPVMTVIERRRDDEAATVAKAQALRDEAAGLKAEYESRLAQAAEDHERAVAALDAEIALERARRLAALEAEIDVERRRRQALEDRERGERDAERERQAIGLAARFAARLLSRMAGPALEDKLIDSVLAELPSIDAGRRAALQSAIGQAGARVEVRTAHPLAPARRSMLTSTLNGLAGRTLAPEFAEEPALEAGLSIMAGSWALSASVRDELEFFQTVDDHVD